MSNEFGWKRRFNRANAEQINAIAASEQANKFPPKLSIVFQTKVMVKAPKRAGKNLTQNSV